MISFFFFLPIFFSHPLLPKNFDNFFFKVFSLLTCWWVAFHIQMKMPLPQVKVKLTYIETYLSFLEPQV